MENMMATPPPLKPPAEKNNDTGMNALGELICRLNPYTRLPKDPTTGLQTGLMEVGTLPTADVGSIQTTRRTTSSKPSRALK
jgi:hypothetical protein